MEKIAWTTWNDNGPARASKLHRIRAGDSLDDGNDVKTACGRYLPSENEVEFDADNYDGECKSCKKKQDALDREND